MPKWMLVGMVLMVAAAVAAQEAPRSVPAMRAMTRHDQAMRKAEQEFQRAAIAAKKTLIAELEEAKSQAMQSGQLEEANAIQAAIDSAKVELDRLIGKPQVDHFEIRADQDWQPTIDVRKGQRVEVRASGEWNGGPAMQGAVGPEGTMWNGSRMFYLEARIGDGPAVPVGARGTIRADRDGVLQLRMHDTKHSDNSGRMDVSVSR